MLWTGHHSHLAHVPGYGQIPEVDIDRTQSRPLYGDTTLFLKYQHAGSWKESSGFKKFNTFGGGGGEVGWKLVPF